MQKTTLRQNVKGSDRKWYIVDAQDKVLGRLATTIANALRGKDQPTFTPHCDGGAYIVVTNVEKIRVTGDKENRKNYFRHSGYLGHLKIEKLKEVREKAPSRILESAVKGMIPSTKQRKNQLRRLFLVEGEDHPYQAQKPEPLLAA